MSEDAPEPASRRSGAAGALFRRWWPAVLAGTVLLLSALLRVQELPGFGTCWFRALTGLPCPGCGLTRSFCSISHGDLAAAWEFNPFGLVFYPVFCALLFWPWWSASPAVMSFLKRPIMAKWLPIVTIAAMWGWNIWRMFRS